jgi:hypothetical protein
MSLESPITAGARIDGDGAEVHKLPGDTHTTGSISPE